MGVGSADGNSVGQQEHQGSRKALWGGPSSGCPNREEEVDSDRNDISTPVTAPTCSFKSHLPDHRHPPPKRPRSYTLQFPLCSFQKGSILCEKEQTGNSSRRERNPLTCKLKYHQESLKGDKAQSAEISATIKLR